MYINLFFLLNIYLFSSYQLNVCSFSHQKQPLTKTKESNKQHKQKKASKTKPEKYNTIPKQQIQPNKHIQYKHKKRLKKHKT
ncbi:MAG: hypothetical protein CW716_00665 [Candidatus Bathyarchaeum sp.]|nr:MAG: hypothetical protein CW716_00665 [Candidatus Bathyarchaeum sp.]